MTSNTGAEPLEIHKWFESTVVKVGFPVVAAAFLIYFLIFTVNTKLIFLVDQMNNHFVESHDMQNAIDSLKNSVDNSRNEQMRTNLILQQICVNGSALRDRGNCFR